MSIDRDALRRVIWSGVALFLVLAILEWFPARSAVDWIDLTLLGRIIAVIALFELILLAARGDSWERLVGWIAVFLAAMLVGGWLYTPFAWAMALGLALLGAAGVVSAARSRAPVAVSGPRAEEPPPAGSE